MKPEQLVQLRTMAVDLAVRSFQPGDDLIAKSQAIYDFIIAATLPNTGGKVVSLV